ncbi:hypothetical protein M9H77_24447 [Catharanthus roseus]|uniref:Uncharacterized protein n=1 Tax=Catharanthus roseus TaxID=4058 RepID=A0ACC0AW68_CATRO|nr:hypothetical protein M9H77_24447 [Catharanthus roseus]
MPCLKENTFTDNPFCDPSPSSIPVEVMTISKPALEPTQEPKTNSKSSAPSSSTPIPETSDPILDCSDEEEEHPEAQTQALRDYQLDRDRVCRVPKDHPRTPIPETSDPILDGSDEEEEHPEAQTQALRDYQLARDRVCRVPKDHPRDARAVRGGHPGSPLVTHGRSARLLFLLLLLRFLLLVSPPDLSALSLLLSRFWCSMLLCVHRPSLSPCLSVGEVREPVSEGYNSRSLFSLPLTPRRDSAAARLLLSGFVTLRFQLLSNLFDFLLAASGRRW